MAFIDKDDIRLGKLHPVRSHTSPIERLHPGNLNDRLRPGLFVATGWPHCWRRNDHAAVAAHVYSGTEFRCAALDLDGVAGMLEVPMHRAHGA
jgi:hypothetical protein